MKKAILLIFLFSVSLFGNEFLTVPEKTGYTKTSSYAEVISFIKNIKALNTDMMTIRYFATSTEGKKIPLVILSQEGISKPNETRVFNKPPVLIMANIHAGEVEGKEAIQMLIRDIITGKRKELLKNQTILFIPIFNCDGNDKMSEKNRRDDGPKLAGVRHNGQGYDLNRDYIKLETPEVKGLVSEIFGKWDPVLFVDMHTTNGSFHQEPVTYAPNISPEGDKILTEYMWKKALPAIDDILKRKFNIESIPYGNFIKRDDPSKGWRNGASEGRYGTNYFGLRNRFSILDENYSHADFKTRVKGAYAFIISILEYTSDNIKEMSEMARKADLRAIKSVKNSEFPISFKQEKTYDFIIKSFVFKKKKISEKERDRYPKKWYGDFLVEKTEKRKDYKTTLIASYTPTKTIKLPAGYMLLPSEKSIIKLLRSHGVKVSKIEQSYTTEVELYMPTSIETSKRLFQGHFLHTKLEFKKIKKTVDIIKGSYYVSLSQPLSRLIAYLLEPLSRDSLVKWNFFDRVLIRQWRGYSFYPVYRLFKKPNVSAVEL